MRKAATTRSRMSLQDALLALDIADSTALAEFTRSQCHLPASDWPWVAEALWTVRRRLADLDIPVAYVRATAVRLRLAVEASTFGRQVVRDRHRRAIGHVTVGSFYRRSDGSLMESLIAVQAGVPSEAIPFVPLEGQAPPVARESPAGKTESRQKRAANMQAQWVDTDDPDELALQELQMRGVSRRLAGDRLGWSDAQVEKVWKRLYRRRKDTKTGKCPQTPTRMK